MSSLLGQALVAGIVNGSVFALIAIGFLLVFAASGAVNLAHGEIVVIGMYSSFIALQIFHLPYAAAFVLVCVVGLTAGALMEWVGFRPFLPAVASDTERERVLLVTFISTLALSLAVQGGLSLVASSDGTAFPSVFALEGKQLGPVRFVTADAIIVAVASTVTAALALGLRYTQLGRAMRATAQHADGAALSGIDPRRVSLLAWSASGLVGGIAGLLLGPGSIITPFVGGQYLFIAFAAAVLGGFGSFAGALIGGLALGITQSLFAAFGDTEWASIVPFVLMIAVLKVRPQGLLGRDVTRV
jgi:branched-chain amino acid transport system permease protein